MLDNERALIKVTQLCVSFIWVILIMLSSILVLFTNPEVLSPKDEIVNRPNQAIAIAAESTHWTAPDISAITKSQQGKLIRYGRELVSHTAYYLGPKGKILQTTNGMNCQNCHLEAGTKYFGNNYSGVAANYPKFRHRSGTIESVERRVNDCIERSLNGKALAEDSEEMKAFVAYLLWVGQGIPKDSMPDGVGILSLKKLDRAADAEKGKLVFKTNCVRCHGNKGEGQMAENGIEWKYPPLYGDNSYNVGAGLYRLSRFAGYVKANMPNDVASYDKPLLTDEEAWDVAAFVNSLPRPTKDLSKDWPDISKKPFDHPFGPYADSFSETQHKFGPYSPIVKK